MTEKVGRQRKDRQQIMIMIFHRKEKRATTNLKLGCHGRNRRRNLRRLWGFEFYMFSLKIRQHPANINDNFKDKKKVWQLRRKYPQTKLCGTDNHLKNLSMSISKFSLLWTVELGSKNQMWLLGTPHHTRPFGTVPSLVHCLFQSQYGHAMGIIK